MIFCLSLIQYIKFSQLSFFFKNAIMTNNITFLATIVLVLNEIFIY